MDSIQVEGILSFSFQLGLLDFTYSLLRIPWLFSFLGELILLYWLEFIKKESEGGAQ